MLRVLFTASVVATLAARAAAQPAPSLEVGMLAGASSTNISTTSRCRLLDGTTSEGSCVGSPHDNGGGLVLGAHVRYRVSSFVQLEADVLYAQKGYDAGNPVTLHYVEAPLLVRFAPVMAGTHVRLFAFAGLAPAVLAGCHESGPIYVADPSPHVENYSGPCDGALLALDVTPDRLDLGGVFGVGFGWQLGIGAIEVQARGERGLVDTVSGDGDAKTINHATYVVAGFSASL